MFTVYYCRSHIPRVTSGHVPRWQHSGISSRRRDAATLEMFCHRPRQKESHRQASVLITEYAARKYPVISHHQNSIVIGILLHPGTWAQHGLAQKRYNSIAIARVLHVFCKRPFTCRPRWLVCPEGPIITQIPLHSIPHDHSTKEGLHDSLSVSCYKKIQ